jgi:hypothetical protein
MRIFEWSDECHARPFFQQQNPNGIGLFAGGAAGHPDSHRFVRLLDVEQLRDDMSFERLENVAVAEKSRHRDKEIAKSACASSALSRRNS